VRRASATTTAPPEPIARRSWLAAGLLLTQFDPTPLTGDDLTSARDGGGAGHIFSHRLPAPLQRGLVAHAKVNPLDPRLYFNDQFSFLVPDGFVDQNQEINSLLSEGDEEGGRKELSFYGDSRASKKTSPFAARFISPDGLESVSVVTKETSKVKLSLLQPRTIEDFGAPLEAAKYFVPPEGKLLTVDRRVEDKQTLYEFEFLARNLHVIMEVVVRLGIVYVLAASAPPERFETASERLRESARSFLLG